MSGIGRIKYVCLSERKGTTKQVVDSGKLIDNYGFEGDAHAGDWHRQISLLDEADIEAMRSNGLDLKPGAFGENLVLEGVDLDDVGIGSLIRIGDSEVEITQIGKVCHTRCQIYYLSGDCIMPRLGLFARVNVGGEITPGLPVEISRLVERKTIQAAVLTVSDSCAAGKATDTSGPAVSELLRSELDAHVGWSGIVADEEKDISSILKDLPSRKFDLIVTTGGTGFGPRDITPEVTRKIVDRDVPGFAEAMRAASARITDHAWLQRGVCGIYRSTLIINLPGSKKGAVENLKSIINLIPHAIRHLRGDTHDHS
ncbi:MAG TPA: MOSC domain-containing protein [Bacteroidetes bacterium]|nr:molybdopterin adenylyltransferase [bacterium BMS3Bbin04]HDO65108.1 MOSC domain-containing protein [Bacteroidota bacterium]HEX04233.1 MOSC domain-containing protein [Bacteroidota bacterium]